METLAFWAESDQAIVLFLIGLLNRKTEQDFVPGSIGGGLRQVLYSNYAGAA
jgi:hypothetical protein